MPPLLNHDWISYTTCPGNDGQDYLITECSLFTLMHDVLRRQYSPNALQSDPCASPPDQIKKLEYNEQRLTKWLTACMPSDDLDCILDASKFLGRINSSTPAQKRRLLRVFYLYHKAVFFIFCPWVAPLTTKVDDNGVSGGAALVMRLCCIENSIGSAIALIQVASHLSNIQERDISKVQQAWQELHQLLPTSLCLILFYMVVGSKRERLQVMPYLGMFSGFIGCIAVNIELRALLDDYFIILTSEGFG